MERPGTNPVPALGDGPPVLGCQMLAEEMQSKFYSLPRLQRDPGGAVVATVTLLLPSHWLRTDTATLQEATGEEALPGSAPGAQSPSTGTRTTKTSETSGAH